MPTKKKTDAPAATPTAVRRYHLVTSDGERTVTAAGLDVSMSGALVFLDGKGEASASYAAGSWRYVELETQDERNREDA